MGIVQESLELVKIAAKIANPQLTERVTALNEKVLELSSQNVEFQQRIFQLERELQRAEEKLSVIGETERRDGFIYRKGDTYPCCPRCFDVDRRLVGIVKSRSEKIGIHPLCPQCETIFGRWPEGIFASV